MRDAIKKGATLVIGVVAITVVAVLILKSNRLGTNKGDLANRATLPVTGEYYRGDGLSSNCSLVLRDDSSFGYTSKGCVGKGDQDQGVYRLEDGIVVLEPKPQRSQVDIPRRLIAVYWGERIYLVPESELNAFRAHARDGREPRRGMHGRFYLKRGDDQKPASGMPDIPASRASHMFGPSSSEKVRGVMTDKEKQEIKDVLRSW